MSPRRGDPKQKAQTGGLPSWLIFVGIGILAIAGVFFLFNLQTSASPAPRPPGTTTTASTGRTKGDPTAKVELIDWSDFQ
jgi:hypothetical protein